MAPLWRSTLFLGRIWQCEKKCDTTLVRLVIDHENDCEIWLLNYHFFVIRNLIYNVQVRLWTRFWFWATELRIQMSVLATKSLTCAMVASHKSCSPKKNVGTLRRILKWYAKKCKLGWYQGKETTTLQVVQSYNLHKAFIIIIFIYRSTCTNSIVFFQFL